MALSPVSAAVAGISCMPFPGCLFSKVVTLVTLACDFIVPFSAALVVVGVTIGLMLLLRYYLKMIVGLL